MILLEDFLVGNTDRYPGASELELGTLTPLPMHYANIPASDREHNIIISHSGYGDGAFPILLTSDTGGPLAIHIDFGVLNTGEDDDINTTSPAMQSNAGHSQCRAGSWADGAATTRCVNGSTYTRVTRELYASPSHTPIEQARTSKNAETSALPYR